MLTKDEIVARLKKVGCKDQDIDSTIEDVMNIILQKSISDYLSRLPESEQTKLKVLKSNDDILAHIAKNKDRWSSFSPQELEKVYEETWEDYFRYMSHS